jgi:hypothetical protein
MNLKKIDLILIGYVLTLIIDFIFLIIVHRYEIIFISGPLALIPLIITLIQRKRA